jgi:GNAT superfamily N-acetyltransferase
MSTTTISLLENPSEEDRLAILNPLLVYNDANIPDDRFERIAIMLRDEAGEAVGGLWAKLYYDWIFVELLFVPESLRGQDLGSKLLAQVEEIAKEKACTGVWLDTFSFQAPGFYEKQGYERFGVLENYPKGLERIFFRKVF